MKLNDIPPAVYYIGAAAVAAFVLYRMSKNGVSAVVDAITPWSDTNIAYTGQERINEAVFGTAPGGSVGSNFYDTVQWWKWKLGMDYDESALVGYSDYKTPETSADQMRSYSYPGGATYPAREGSNPFLPDYVQSYGYEAPAPYRYDVTSK